MKTRKLVGLLVWLMILSGCAGGGGGKFSISGYVHDTFGQPIPEVEIIFAGVTSGHQFTNAQGGFVIGDLESVTSILAHKKGWRFGPLVQDVDTSTGLPLVFTGIRVDEDDTVRVGVRLTLGGLPWGYRHAHSWYTVEVIAVDRNHQFLETLDLGAALTKEERHYDLSLLPETQYLVVYLGNNGPHPLFFGMVELDLNYPYYANYFWAEHEAYVEEGRLVYGVSESLAIELDEDTVTDFSLDFEVIPYYLFKVHGTDYAALRLSIESNNGVIQVQHQRSLDSMHHSESMLVTPFNPLQIRRNVYHGGVWYVMVTSEDYTVPTWGTLRFDHERELSLRVQHMLTGDDAELGFVATSNGFHYIDLVSGIVLRSFRFPYGIRSLAYCEGRVYAIPYAHPHLYVLDTSTYLYQDISFDRWEWIGLHSVMVDPIERRIILSGGSHLVLLDMDTYDILDQISTGADLLATYDKHSKWVFGETRGQSPNHLYRFSLVNDRLIFDQSVEVQYDLGSPSISLHPIGAQVLTVEGTTLNILDGSDLTKVLQSRSLQGPSGETITPIATTYTPSGDVIYVMGSAQQQSFLFELDSDSLQTHAIIGFGDALYEGLLAVNSDETLLLAASSGSLHLVHTSQFTGVSLLGVAPDRRLHDVMPSLPRNVDGRRRIPTPEQIQALANQGGILAD